MERHFGIIWGMGLSEWPNGMSSEQRGFTRGGALMKEECVLGRQITGRWRCVPRVHARCLLETA